MTQIKIPKLSEFKKEIIEHDSDGKISEAEAYTHTYKNGYKLLIEKCIDQEFNFLDEDTYCWCVFLITPTEVREIVSGCSDENEAYTKTLDFMKDKRFATRADQKLVTSIAKQLKETSDAHFKCDVETSIYNNRTVSVFLSCRKCKSKLARAYIQSNKCPLCGTDLRTEKIVRRLAVLESKLDELRSTYNKLTHDVNVIY